LFGEDESLRFVLDEATFVLSFGAPFLSDAWGNASVRTGFSAARAATQNRAVARFGDAPEGLSQLVIGGREIGEALASDARVPLVSATGSTRRARNALTSQDRRACGS
jgi:acyl-CoA reductase-like NAD-dependent aldehyde dehydrogenase